MRDTPLIDRAVRMLARILRLYPQAFRDAFAADMLLTFRDQCRAKYAKSGAVGVIGLWLITVLNVIWEAGREHTDSLARLGALAWMLGGALWVLIHLPINIGWLPIPIFALLLLIFGLACLLAQVALYARPITLIGFILTGLGQTSILAGYCAALFGLWDQTGVPSLVGTGLQCAGLLMLGLSMRYPNGPRTAWQ